MSSSPDKYGSRSGGHLEGPFNTISLSSRLADWFTALILKVYLASYLV